MAEARQLILQPCEQRRIPRLGAELPHLVAQGADERGQERLRLGDERRKRRDGVEPGRQQ
jgi:hypothetical protein